MDEEQKKVEENLPSAGEQEQEKQMSEPVKIVCHNCGQKLDVTSCEPFSLVACPHCQTSLIVPRWFDSYLLEEIVGEGGMATVYRALDPALDREVAVKILRVTEKTDENFQELFLGEARTAASVNHQSVIAVYACSSAEGSPYIVMEYMGGGSLEKLLEKKSGTLEILQVCKWILSIADGLERAARQGIVHHDIKPANIMMDHDGNVKIGDFGIAQKRFGRSSGDPGTENSWGSPYYVSPEKAKDGTESFSGDIYSLGAAFYHLLTGIPPFNEYEEIEELVYARIDKDPLCPDGIRKDIPAELSAFIMSMMARDPRVRPGYQEIRAFLASFIKKYSNGKEEEASCSFPLKAGNGSITAAEKKISVSVPEDKKIFPESPERENGKKVFRFDFLVSAGVFILASLTVFISSFLLFRMFFTWLKG